MRIGIDVGGTNTDAVLIDHNNEVVTWSKRPTSKDISSGIASAAWNVLEKSGARAADIEAVMIGTTHFSNAFIERERLSQVGVIRIALPASEGIPPLISWPDDVVSCIGRHVFLVEGGYQYDGKTNSALDEQAVCEAARELKDRGVESVAITGLFSSVNPDMELRAAAIVRAEMGDVAVTLSHATGSIGILMRENSAIINASLSRIAVDIVESFRRALSEIGISAPFYVSQNDGTLMSAEFTVRYPVLTFASGQTNSLRGAALLSKVKDGIVVDIGGTTSDIGVLVNGFPRESSMTADIGGIRTNFRMPDVLTLGLGGGSLVHYGTDTVKVGPKSLGYRLPQEGMVFGGGTLTATDIAVAAGYVQIGDPSAVRSLPPDVIEAAVSEMHHMITAGVERMKTNATPQPLILVGGGSILLNREIAGCSDVITPNYSLVANAVGASIAKVGGEVDRVYSYGDLGRDQALEDARAKAISQAISAGAEDDGGVEVVSIEELPLPYVSSGAVRVRVKAVGNLRFGRMAPETEAAG